jgi:hypothetical protein
VYCLRADSGYVAFAKAFAFRPQNDTMHEPQQNFIDNPWSVLMKYFDGDRCHVVSEAFILKNNTILPRYSQK